MTQAGARRSGESEVPDLVGLTVHVARQTGHDAGLVVTSRDVDGPPLSVLTWPGTWVVTAQHPPPGTRLPRWENVMIDFEKLSGD
ncbi:PASTA domain-containing protein [Streptosporangium sp. NPDC051022]|uniref:PASTA domain-containing protein n=1 Tax=Streptosporangium sp. NPDC051022 TaxID=3155752 RepID=UPI00343D3A61